MAPMTRPLGSGDDTAARILDAASRLLAEQGPRVSMAAVASAARVGPVTLDRYFPSRDALVEALTTEAHDALSDGLERAELDQVTVHEGIARATRSLLQAILPYLGLRREPRALDRTAEAEARLGKPVRALILRGVEEGALRQDVSPTGLLQLYSSLIKSGVELLGWEDLGLDSVSGSITSVFPDGATQGGQPLAPAGLQLSSPGPRS